MYLMSLGVQLRLDYSWTRPAVLAAGKGREECFYFFCFFTSIHFPLSPLSLSFICSEGWLGEAKVSCILRHRGVQLILAYSWARPAILAAGKSRGGMFLFLLLLHFYLFSVLPCPSLSSPLLSLLSLLPFCGRQHKMTHKG